MVRGRVIAGFEIDEEVGHGAFSTVYKARHQNGVVALKVLDATVAAEMGNEARLFLRREAAALAKVNHPNVVRVFELNETDGASFLATEFIQGTTLAALIARSMLDENRCLEIGSQVAGGLSAAHAAGLVHRDIKPANILIDTDGHVRLIDFGFVAAERLQDPEQAVGTFAYAAPEQSGALESVVDKRADLYALGVVLFEASTGQLPFRAQSLVELISQHRDRPAPSARSLNPGLTEGFAAVIERLLQKDPARRYPTADALAHDLERLRSTERSGRQAIAIVAGRTPTPLAASAVVGREKERLRLRALWAEAGAGAGSTIVLRGESGMGKSQLANDLAHLASSEGATVLRGKGSEGAAGPLQVVRRMLEDHLHSLDGLEGPAKEEGLRAMRLAAREVEEVLQEVSAPFATALGLTAQVSRALNEVELIEGLAQLLARLSSQAGALLVIDDVQWLDDLSRRALGRASKLFRQTRTLMVCTARTEELHQEAVGHFLRLCGGPPELRLSPLSREGAELLVRERLGAGELDPVLIDRVTALSSGNPFVVGEVLHSFVEEGLLRFSWNRWLIDAKRVEASSLEGGVVELIQRRLARLSSEASEALALAAIFGARFSVQSLQRGLSDARSAARALDEAIGAGVLFRASDEDLAFVHDRLREAVLSKLDPARRRELHAAAIRALEAEAVEHTPVVHELARHYREVAPANPTERAGTVLALAGERALREFDYRGADRCFSTAFDLFVALGRAWPSRLLMLWGDALAAAGEAKAAEERYRQALLGAKTSLERARYYERLAKNFNISRDTQHAIEMIDAGIKELGSWRPKGPLGTFWCGLAVWLAALFVFKTGVGYGRAAGQRRERALILADLMAIESFVLVGLGTPQSQLRWVYIVFLSLFVGGRLGPSSGLVTGILQYLVLLGILKRKRSLPAWEARAREVVKTLGDASLAGAVNYGVGNAWLFANEPRRSERFFWEAWTARALAPDIRVHAAATLVEFLDMRWDTDRLVQLLKDVEDELGNTAHTSNVRGRAAGAFAMRGDFATAEANIKTTAEMAARTRDSLVEFVSVCSLVALQREREAPPAEVDETFARMEVTARKLAVAGLTVNYGVMRAYCLIDRAFAAPKLSPDEGAALTRALASLEKMHRQVWPEHAWAIKGAAQALTGQLDEAFSSFGKAEAACRRDGNLAVQFRLSLYKALIAKRSGDELAGEADARAAMALAQKHAWKPTLARLQRDLRLATAAQPAALDGSTNLASMVLKSRVVKLADRNQQRLADALLRVAASTASVFSFEDQAAACLKELVQLLDAERAFLFVAKDGALAFLSGVDGAGGPLLERPQLSETVLEKAWSTGEPVVVSSLEQGAELGAQSVVLRGLRSVVAAPLVFRGEALGAVYLDSTVKRGGFGAQDLAALDAVSGHIGMALETAKMAQLEVERVRTQKDLALSAVVQTMLLPREKVTSLGWAKVCGFYRPATECGGDFWACAQPAPGRCEVWLGDVSGHGAGPAMVTALVSGAHRVMTTRSDLGEEPLPALSALLRQACQGAYTMTMARVSFGEARGALVYQNAGGPPLMIRGLDGAVRPVLLAGSVLGSSEVDEVGEARLRLEPGELLLLFSDGILDLERGTGRKLSLATLRQLFSQAPGNAEAAVSFLAAQVEESLAFGPQRDDISFVVLEAS